MDLVVKGGSEGDDAGALVYREESVPVAPGDAVPHLVVWREREGGGGRVLIGKVARGRKRGKRRAGWRELKERKGKERDDGLGRREWSKSWVAWQREEEREAQGGEKLSGVKLKKEERESVADVKEELMSCYLRKG